jgi:hypothetical protein
MRGLKFANILEKRINCHYNYKLAEQDKAAAPIIRIARSQSCLLVALQ